MNDRYDISYKYSREMEHEKWRNEIPLLEFPATWKIKMLPPFAGAVVRFMVELNGKTVSVYLDCYDMLGCYGEPYWEIYPYNNDIFRCDMKNTEALLSHIKQSLEP